MRMKINRMKKTCLLTSLWEPNWHLYKLEPLVSGKARSFHSLPNSITFPLCFWAGTRHFGG
jgi:hypothetical protein